MCLILNCYSVRNWSFYYYVLFLNCEVSKRYKTRIRTNFKFLSRIVVRKEELSCLLARILLIESIWHRGSQITRAKKPRCVSWHSTCYQFFFLLFFSARGWFLGRAPYRDTARNVDNNRSSCLGAGVSGSRRANHPQETITRNCLRKWNGWMGRGYVLQGSLNLSHPPAARSWIWKLAKESPPPPLDEISNFPSRLFADRFHLLRTVNHTEPQFDALPNNHAEETLVNGSGGSFITG